jgi:hypothetical protein
MTKTFLRSIVFLLVFGAYAFPQKMDGVEVTDAGTFEGNINGKEFNNPIRYGEAEDLVSIAAGDENFTLTINCSGVSKISDLKSGTYKLPSDENIKVLYLDNNAAIPCIISGGTLTITKNDSKELKGTLEFTAAMGGIPKEMGGSETKLTSGKFEINKMK